MWLRAADWEIQAKPAMALGEDPYGLSTAYEWMRRFLCTRKGVQDMPHHGRSPAEELND
jgi:hypothetical protein